MSETLPVATRFWFSVVCAFRILFDGMFAARVWGVRDETSSPGPLSLKSRGGAEEEPGGTRGRTSPPDPLSLKGRGGGEGEPGFAQSDGRESPGLLPPRSFGERGAGGGRLDSSALQMLAALQREGRLLDFLEEDIQGFSDADIGAVVREVHAGCRKVIREHAPLEPVRSESEGSSVTIEAGFDPAQIKLTGDVKGAGPYRGTLRHRGWRVREWKLPTLLRTGGARADEADAADEAGSKGDKGSMGTTDSMSDARIVAPAEVEL